MNKLTVFLALLASLLTTSSGAANELSIEDAWIREAPPVSKVQAAYMQIHNNTNKELAVISASSPSFGRIEFHRTVTDNGVMRMLQEDKLVIPAKSELQLQPDGSHMMLFNPRQALRAGDEVPFTLTFSDQRQLDLILIVKKAIGAAHQHHGHHE